MFCEEHKEPLLGEMKSILLWITQKVTAESHMEEAPAFLNEWWSQAEGQSFEIAVKFLGDEVIITGRNKKSVARAVGMVQTHPSILYTL